MSEWQPIETAPKDGSVVLLFSGNKQMAVCFYWSARNNWTTAASGAAYWDATHWMPLPEPPK